MSASLVGSEMCIRDRCGIMQSWALSVQIRRCLALLGFSSLRLEAPEGVPRRRIWTTHEPKRRMIVHFAVLGRMIPA
eukprot:10965547-Alexandrium_andersonii.AAC.1